MEVTKLLYYCNSEKQFYQMLKDNDDLKGSIRAMALNPDACSQLIKDIIDVITADKQSGFCRSIDEMATIVGIFMYSSAAEGLGWVKTLADAFEINTKFRLAKCFFDFLYKEYISINETHMNINVFRTHYQSSFASEGSISRSNLRPIIVKETANKLSEEEKISEIIIKLSN